MNLDIMGATAAFTTSSTSVTPAGEEVAFDAVNSSSPDDAITSYECGFGNKSSETGTSVSPSYADPDEYIMTLTMTDKTGVTDSTTATITGEAASGALDPATTIQLDGRIDDWKGTAPETIAGETNPTLTLEAGTKYTVEFTSADGNPHVLYDSADERITDIKLVVSGCTSLTALAEMAISAWAVHPDSISGDVEVI